MEGAASSSDLTRMGLERDQRISDVVRRDQSRLLNFIRRRVPDPRDAEDVLQDVFYELVEANRLLMPIDHVTGWLFRVARNRIIDLFRKKQPKNFSDLSGTQNDDLYSTSSATGGQIWGDFEDMLLSPEAGPEALYAREVLLA